MKIFAKILLVSLIALISYEAFAVIQARSKTKAIFSSALKSENIEIKLNDLSKEKLDSLLSVEDPKFYEHSGFDFKTSGAGVTTITQATSSQSIQYNAGKL